MPVILPTDRRDELRRSMMMYFTGFSRFASDIAREKIKNFKSRTQQLMTIRAMVDQSLAIRLDEKTPLKELGRLLYESWLLKRELTVMVSTLAVDEIYEGAMNAGAVGGKLLGAGGGGFILFFVELGARERVVDRLEDSGPCRLRFRPRGRQDRALPI